MAVTALFGALPWGWRIAFGAGVALALGGAFGAGAIKGFEAGHSAAKAGGDAALAVLERDYARQRAEHLARYAVRVRQETERAMQASAALARAKEEHATIQAGLRARVAAITRNSVHCFSADFVRLFNEAVGAAPIHGRGTSGSAGTPAFAGTGAGVVSGVRGTTGKRGIVPAGGGAGAAGRTGERTGHGDEPGLSPSGPAPHAEQVSEKDVLSYIIYYGKRSQDMEAQLAALVRIMGEGK